MERNKMIYLGFSNTKNTTQMLFVTNEIAKKTEINILSAA